MAIATISIAASATKGGTTQAPVVVSSAAPAVPANGTLWFNQDTGALLLYFDDGNSQQWVKIGAGY